MKFSLKLKELRESRGITQRELAEALNISKGSIGMWESTDRVPNAKRLKSIADYFKISVDELLDIDSITPSERASGVTATRREEITPLEDDLLYNFRKLGEQRGDEAQQAVVDMLEKMLK